MRRLYSRWVRLLRRIRPLSRAPSHSDRSLIDRLPVVGARFEDNGWVLEIWRTPRGIEIILCGTYGERVAGGPLPVNRTENPATPIMFLLDCGDVILEISPESWATEIRTLGGQLIGHVPRLRLTESLKAVA